MRKELSMCPPGSGPLSALDIWGYGVDFLTTGQFAVHSDTNFLVTGGRWRPKSNGWKTCRITIDRGEHLKPSF